MYIYTVEDLINFRESVKAGETFEGKEVYLMNDLDLSLTCSEKLGSFEPIGAGSTSFRGTFHGNHHKISNLYINQIMLIFHTFLFLLLLLLSLYL